MNLNLPEKLYYSIGEIAEAFGVKTSLLRFWEKEFELLKPKKNLKGTRRYSRVDIENIGLIYSLVKKRGFTIDGAKEKIKNDSDKINVLKKLEKLITENHSYETPCILKLDIPKGNKKFLNWLESTIL